MEQHENTWRAFGILAALLLILSALLFFFYDTSKLSVDVQQTPPQIVSQIPMEGQRLNLSDSVTLIFDRDMDSASSDSFAFLLDGQPVSGRGVWSDARTFTFTPQTPLLPATVYTAVFSSPRAADGASADELRVEFTTVEALAVSQFFPAANASDVDLNANITVIFNHPVVPLGMVEEQAKLPQPVTFSPSISGRGEWLNSSVYIFTPEAKLKSGTTYSARVEKGLTDTLGNALQDSLEWKFSTRGAFVANFALKGGAQNPPVEVTDVPLNQEFIITFGQPMNAQSVESALKIENRESGETMPVKFLWNDDFTELTIAPQKNFALAGFYRLTISDSALAQDGGALQSGLEIKFSTVSLPAISNIYPAPNSTEPYFSSSIAITFVSPMNAETLNDKIKISPALVNESFYYSEYEKTLYINGLQPGVDYVVRILPGMADQFGNTIKDEFSYTFKNGDYYPYAWLMMPWTPLVYREKGIQDIFLEYVNLDEAVVSVYPLSLKEFGDLSSGKVALNEFNPQVKTVREWQLKSEEKNKSTRERLLLGENGEGLPPGFYFVGLNGKPLDVSGTFYQGALFIVATDNVTFKATGSESLAWVTDLESGVPQEGLKAVFYDNEFRQVGAATTNADGIAHLKDAKNVNYVQVEGEGRFAFSALYWGSGVYAGDFGIYESYYGAESNLFAYLYTDRPVYRPNQEVFFKGILRADDDMHYSLPNQKQVYVVAEQWGNKIFAEYVPVNELGSFSGALKLAEDVSLGSYMLHVYQNNLPDQAPISSVGFSVAEYKKPEYEVSASVDKSEILAGNSVQFNMDAAYYSGGNLQGAEVQWFAESSPYYFTPKEKYNRFNFMDWDRDLFWDAQQDRSREIYVEGNGVTDENGHFETEQILELGEGKLSQNVTFYANVTDVAGNTVSGSAGVVVHQSEIYAGIRSERYIGAAGEEQTFQLVALDWESNPIAGQTIRVDFVKREWFSIQKKDDQGTLRWETSVKETPVGSQDVVTDADGFALAGFVPPSGGVYKALATATDKNGYVHQSSAYIWVWSNEAVAWRQTNDRAFSLIADKDEYMPGDTAEILIAQPFEHDVYALVTYERGHIYKQEVMLLKGNSTIYKLPITADLAPVAYVSVTVISGAEKSGKPDFKIGMTKININTAQQEIKVQVKADKESAGPGDEVTYTITTMDINGKPVSADVSLAVVDKAALALAPANSAPMLSSFYGQRGLGVITSLAIVSSADDFNENYRKSIADGQASGGGGGGELGVITARENFKDTAIFEARVVTDENGFAQVKVKLPENLTTWSAEVKAVTADTRVGEGKGELTTSKPLFVNLQTPRFFIVGDKAILGATVFNNTNKPLKADVLLDAQGVTLLSDKLQSVEVKAKSQAYVTWNVEVEKTASRVDLTATVTSGTFTDASKPAVGTLSNHGIPVYNFTVKETLGTSGMIDSANSAAEFIQLPRDFTFDDASLSVELAPSLAASMTAGLDYLADYPYLCMEQTISRILPNVIAARALNEAKLPSLIRSDLDSNVNAALQRIYAKQLYDGGWNWWDGGQSDPQTSAYVVYGLLEAKESGYTISESVLKNGVNYLKKNLPKVRANDAAWVYNRHAFMLYVLARANALQAGQTNALFENRAAMQNYGKAYLAQAIHLLDKEDPRVNTLMSDLLSSAVLSSTGAHWEESERDFYNWNSDTRSTAIVLNAFIQIDPKNPITANAVRWLMSNREGGYWRSTQDTAWSLIALTNWLVETKEFQSDYQYAIGLNGEKIQEGKVTKENLTQKVNLQIGIEDLLKEQANALVFARGRGKGNLYYSAYLTASLPVEKISPLDRGMSVTREYFTLDDVKTPITEIKRGELVKVRLTLVLPAAAHYLVLDDPLPAGLEAVDQTLLTDTAVPTSYTLQDYKDKGWGWWYFTHTELRDEKVTLSADYLPAGTYVYTYVARASSAGTFKVIPPTAFEFYFPDVAGRGAGSLFTVKP